MTQYATLDEALTDIAGRSFYESASVTPNDDGTFTVDEFQTGEDDCLTWTYAGGIEAPSSAIDYSRLMESYEFFETAGHIHYNVGAAVGAILSGKAVAFQYVILDAYCEDPLDENGEPDCDGEHTVGWAIVAYYA